MCPKIRCDRESEKFCKIFCVLHRAMVISCCGDIWLFRWRRWGLLASPAAAAVWPYQGVAFCGGVDHRSEGGVDLCGEPAGHVGVSPDEFRGTGPNGIVISAVLSQSMEEIGQWPRRSRLDQTRRDHCHHARRRRPRTQPPLLVASGSPAWGGLCS
jgi:hypothetical protein